MKFVIDHQLPPALAHWLGARGHEAAHVFLLGMGEAEDRLIWDLALSEGAIVVTKDIDFAERRQRVSAGPTILWLRVGNTTTPELFATLERGWPLIEARLATDPVVEVR